METSDWSHLPLDIIMIILAKLPPQSIRYMCNTNASFNQRLCQSDHIWKTLYEMNISANVPLNNVEEEYTQIMDEARSLLRTQRLIFGAENGYEQMVVDALNAGADIHGWHDKALREAAENGHHNIVEILLSHGANINPEFGPSHAPLSLAARNGDCMTVKLLLSHGALDFNPALREAIWGSSECRKFSGLLARKFPTGHNSEYRKFLGASAKKFPTGHNSESNYLQDCMESYYNTIKLLLDSGAIVGTEVLNLARRFNDPRILDLLHQYIH